MFRNSETLSGHIILSNRAAQFYDVSFQKKDKIRKESKTLSPRPRISIP